MRIHHRHPWDVTPQQAIAIQEQLRPLVICQDELGALATVAGVDASFDEGSQLVCAAAVVLSFPDLQIQEHAFVSLPLRFPYIPGLLSFREAPAILAALERLKSPPSLLLCDGQGLAHPRRFGLACHMGLLCDLPSIGVAKSRLLGRHEPVAQERGAWQPLLDGEEVVGAALRTRQGARPLYVSIGHRISLQTAVDLALRCCSGYRLPEPLRLAHKLASP